MNKTDSSQKTKVFLFTCATEEARNKLAHKELEKRIPLGLLYLDAVLKKNNYDVLTKDYSPKTEKEFLEDIESIIKTFNPEVVGISIVTLTRVSAYKAIKLVKQINSKIKIIMGGIHATLMYEQLLENFDIDAVCIGEGEKTILELLDAFEKKKSLKNIKGIAYKEGNKIIKTKEKEPVNLEELPFPSYDLLSSNYESIYMLSSRGCSFGCVFCSEGNKKVRLRSPKNVVDEIEFITKTYPKLKYLTFWDENITIDQQRTIEICKEIIKRNIKLKYVCQSRIKPVSRELFYWMEKAGFEMINFGVESGSNQILKNIKKGITKEDVYNTFKLIKEFKGLYPYKYIMVGLPGETKETVDETIKLINSLNKLVSRHLEWQSFYPQPLIVYPGTEIYQIMKEKGLMDDSFWLSDKPAPVFTAEHSVEWINRMASKIQLKTIVSYNKIFFIKKTIKLLLFNPKYFIKAIKNKVQTN
jgi:anaerobic magnesium-protoporphyrin IX monomethyl ester cyclase